MRTLIIISHHFAPSPAVGAKRFSFLTREFVRMGYDVHVITNEVRDSPHGGADVTLPLAGDVHRCAARHELPLPGAGGLTRKLNSLLRRLLKPVGIEYFWAHAAAEKAIGIARGLPAGIVIATSPPYCALIAGARVASGLGWPLIVDYRDPWSAYDWPRWRRGRIAQWLAHRIERRVLAQSAAVVQNTPAMRDWFARYFPRVPAARTFVIPNGFDPVPPAPPPPAAGRVEIVHAGEIFAGRSLLPLLQAAERLRSRHPARPIHLTTYGDLPAAETQRIRAAGLGHLVTVRPRIPFAALFPELQRAHLLVAVSGDHMMYSTPYKVYDYMATGRPILGLAARGSALRAVLEESGAGIGVDPDDPPAIERVLEQLLFGAGIATGGARIERYQWPNLALQFRKVIETVGAAVDAPGRD